MSSSFDQRSLAGLTVSVERADGSAAMQLRGGLHLGVVELLRWSAGRIPLGHRIDLNLGALTFVDVGGYRALRALVDRLRERDLDLTMSRPPRCVVRVERLLDVEWGLAAGVPVGAASGSSPDSDRF